MIRLHEFITKIRNCKTIAQERAQYQKEMAAIRQSFAKNQESVRPRNLTKLLFINMSGQDTNFGQMECLNLITGKSPIQKRIGYLGLTQLFHEKSELLMMSTNRIKVDLASTNTNVIGLALCVVSEICTVELAKQLQGQILKCVENKSNYIKKKAILTSIKVIKKIPESISQFFPKIIDNLQTKNHGVLLSCMAFFETSILLDSSNVDKVANIAGKFYKIYKFISMESNSDYSINGAQDPFLQVAILNLMKLVKRTTDNKEFNSYFLDTVIAVNDVMSGSSLGTPKNGPKSILYECFQCAVLLEPSARLKRIVDDMLTKFISTKDANSKYLSLINLGLMSKYDIGIAKNYKGVIIECLSENDILIQTMALDLLYIISAPDNVGPIIKELLNILLSATDEEFISQLALKICLIVEKHSESRRWQFDTILKVLVLADQAVKEDTSKSLVHLIMSTQQLQKYCMAKLFFSTCQNTQNDALCRITLYLLGELAHILPRISQVEISEDNIVDLIEQIIFKPSIEYDTISYGLSATMKIFDKFPSKREKVLNILRHFESHCDLQVQKRACEYVKLLDAAWDHDRKTEVNVPVPAYKASASAFSSIPIGDTTLQINVSELKMPEKVDITYNESRPQHRQEEGRQIIIQKKPPGMVQETPIVTTKQPKKQTSLLDDDDDDIMGFGTNQNSVQQPPPEKPKENNDDPFGILGLNMGGGSTANTGQNVVNNQQNLGGMGGLDLLGGFGNQQVSQPVVNNPPVKQNQGDLLGDGDLLGGSIPINNNQQIFNQPPPQQPLQNEFNLNQVNEVPQPPVNKQPQTHKFKGFENEHIEIWYESRKESHGQTFIKASFMNKTQSFIDAILIQTAVTKYLKIQINPLNSTALPASSKGGAYQTMTVTNSSVGEKTIVMKIKLSYVINGQKVGAQSKIEGFPLGF